MKITDETRNRIALAMHRQNPKVVSVETATRDFDRYLEELLRKGRNSEEGFWGISTGGYKFEYSRDPETGFEEVDVSLHLVSLYPEAERGEPFEWPAMRVLVDN
jgi:hypothetical protein